MTRQNFDCVRWYVENGNEIVLFVIHWGHTQSAVFFSISSRSHPIASSLFSPFLSLSLHMNYHSFEKSII